MEKRNSRAAATALATCIVLVSAGAEPAYSRDKEFGLLVHHIESYYHARQSCRWLMGFAGLTVKIAHPYGIKSLKLAIFENDDFSAARGNRDFAQVVQAGLREDWQPIVRVYSKRDGERTAIFARNLGDDVQLLVASIESGEAVIMQVKLNPDNLSRFLNDCSHHTHGTLSLAQRRESPGASKPEVAAE